MERRELALEDDDKKQSKRHAGDGQAAPPACQAEKCSADLTQASKYHLRHKVCERHAKASVVVVSGLRQRFCQQCSRFHELSEFDETKRSCRRRLAGHNERRRKSCSTETPAESSGGTASSSEVQESHCWPAGARSKHFQIR